MNTMNTSTLLIPTRLNEWNYEVIKKLVDQNTFETDTFDFKYKFKLPEPGHHENLVNTACALANTRGGFIVFGVQRKDNGLHEIEGIDKRDNIAMEFGQQLNNVNPAINFIPQNPAIEIPGTGKVLPVFHIPKSEKRPHANETNQFYYRTNKGNEHMNYEQIREAFLRYEEQRHNLRLLYLELGYNKNIAQEIKSVGSKASGDFYSELYFEFEIVVRLLPEIYPFIQNDEEFIKTLFELRSLLSTANSRIRMLHSFIPLPLSNKRDLIGGHNAWIVPKIDTEIIPKIVTIQDSLSHWYDLEGAEKQR